MPFRKSVEMHCDGSTISPADIEIIEMPKLDEAINWLVDLSITNLVMDRVG